MMDKKCKMERGPPSILIEKNKIRSDIAHEQKAEYTLFEVDAGMNVEKIL